MVAVQNEIVVGFIRWHQRRDCIATIYEICVVPAFRRQGIGRSLVQSVIRQATPQCHKVQLKCPADLEANRFYASLGFRHEGTLEGKRIPLNFWTCSCIEPYSLRFVASMTLRPGDMRQWIELWQRHLPNLYSNVIISPLFISATALNLVRDTFAANPECNVYFDSGGYQVQCGRLAYEQLYRRLMTCYRANTWANWYVLPDHVPTSNDTPEQIENKVRDTVTVAELFADEMPKELRSKAIAVVQGLTTEQVQRCLERYAELGFQYIGFGSFPTSGSKGSVNYLDNHALERVRHILSFVRQTGQKLHLFGVGNPPLAYVFQKLGVHSFDSLNWFKAATYGNVFLPFSRAFNVTHRTPGQSARSITWAEFQAGKENTQHDCPFCQNDVSLRSDRIMRAAHNLVVMNETLERLHQWDDTGILDSMQGQSRYYSMARKVIENV